MSYKWPSKYSNELLDFSMDWVRVLAQGETIATSVWSWDEGIEVSMDTFGPKVTTIWLTGGSPGRTYQFSNTVTTTEGRTYTRQASLRINTECT